MVVGVGVDVGVGAAHVGRSMVGQNISGGLWAGVRSGLACIETLPRVDRLRILFWVVGLKS